MAGRHTTTTGTGTDDATGTAGTAGTPNRKTANVVGPHRCVAEKIAVHMNAAERIRRTVIAVIAAGGTIHDAATTAGTDAGTVQTWMADPVFADALDAARERAFHAATARLKSGTGIAVARLLAMVNDKSSTAALRACEMVITLALKIRDADDIEKRLDEIENRLADRRPKPKIGG